MKSYLGWRIDFAAPGGAKSLSAPDSMHWRVYKNPVALAIGGVAAVLMEFAEPRIRSGVWDHSTFAKDPLGRSHRTAMAALIGVYAPEAAARRVIQGVNNMHAKIGGQTPTGEPYRALEPDLLNWVAATASYGFLTAYDVFAAPLSEAERKRFYREAAGVAALYGVTHAPRSDADFSAMLERLAPRFEPHDIVRQFLAIVESGRGAPAPAGRTLARAAVSILPAGVRAVLELGARYDLGRTETHIIKGLAALAERTPIPGSPPVQASRRLGLPANFLFRSAGAQQRALAQI